MQNTKYDELKSEHATLATKLAAQHRLSQSSLVLLKNIDARIEGIKALLIKFGAFNEEDYQDAVDEKLGLRRKLGNETMEVGDVCWVSYVADIEGSIEKQVETGIPVRLGSNSLMFESALIGQRCDAEGIKFEGKWKEANPAEPLKPFIRNVSFTIDVARVKTRRKDDTGNGISDDIERADGTGGENSDIAMLESDGVNNGSGLTGDNDGETQHT